MTRRTDRKRVLVTNLRPGQSGMVERGVFARRNSEGKIKYGISYFDKAAHRQVRRMAGPTTAALCSLWTGTVQLTDRPSISLFSSLFLAQSVLF